MNLDADSIKRGLLESLAKADEANRLAGWGTGKYTPGDLRAAIIGAAQKQNPAFNPDTSYADQMTLSKIHSETTKAYHGHGIAGQADRLAFEQLNEMPGSLHSNSRIPGRKATPFDTPKREQPTHFPTTDLPVKGD